MSIAERYAQLRAAVPAHVTILAVSKFHPVEAVRQAVAAGVTDIGENYVQEAQRKFGHGELARGELVEPRKHFIGHVQTNKAKAIASTFDVVQSVDRADAASALAKAAASLGKRLPVLLQLNISPSERFGCPPADAAALAQLIRSHESLELQGVMAIGPIAGDESEIAEIGNGRGRLRGEDRLGRPVILFGTEWDLRYAEENAQHVTFESLSDG